MELKKKYEQLKEYLIALGSVAVAFSGGVDSAFLLKAAKEALGDKAAAVTVHSCFMPHNERKEAQEFCRLEQIRQIICEVNPLSVDGIADNPPNRCYLCKKEIFKTMQEAAAQHNFFSVVEGSNLDDNDDYRPGLRAIRELGIKSPLLEVGFSKQEIREMSKRLKISTWNKPSFACLASRFTYGDHLTEENLKRVEQAEAVLAGLAFQQFRVRSHGDMARVEVPPEDFLNLLKYRKQVYKAFQLLGFAYVSMDLEGYRTGSMNEVLGKMR